MNTSASEEQFNLQGLTNTLTHYYGVTDFLPTMDREIYESDHILYQRIKLYLLMTVI